MTKSIWRKNYQFEKISNFDIILNPDLLTKAWKIAMMASIPEFHVENCKRWKYLVELSRQLRYSDCGTTNLTNFLTIYQFFGFHVLDLFWYAKLDTSIAQYSIWNVIWICFSFNGIK